MKKQLLSIFAISVLNTVSNAQCQPAGDCIQSSINTFELQAVTSTLTNDPGVCHNQSSNPLGTHEIGSIISWSVTLENNSYPSGIGIWIDLNNDNEFSSSEFVAASSPSYFPNGSFIMPSGVIGGLRLRVRSLPGGVPIATQACTYVTEQGNYYAETEDYYIFLSPSLNTPTFNELVYKIFPNPSNSTFTIEIDKNALIEVYDLVGKQIVKKILLQEQIL
jgi:hypothetical protein